jgi:AcrR family transcriptional regulator
MREHDLETHARLLNAAAELFAARGFKDVTIREICGAAGANVAAVNYHFGGKLGLHREVLNKAIDTMRATTDAARRAGEGGTPDERLRAYVRVFARRVGQESHDSWIHRLMAREIADPTPALDLIAEHVIEPRLGYVGEIVAEMLGRPPDDEAVRRCVLSIQSLCHGAMRQPLAARNARLSAYLPADASALDRLVEHITEFSLAGVRGLQEVRGARRAHKVRRVRKAQLLRMVQQGQQFQRGHALGRVRAVRKTRSR